MPHVDHRVSMALALALSWVSMLAHNLYELPLAPTAPENAGPLVVAAGLALAYGAAPGSRIVVGAAFGWGLLNLVVGALVTVLPLPILPFTPEQTISHYLAHLGYGLGQVPLVLLAARLLRDGAGRRVEPAPDASA